MPNLYETLLIVTPDADEEAVNAVIGDLRVVVESDGGAILQAGVWERRKLAYQVQGKSEGIYVLMYADGDRTLPAALKQRMKLDEAVIRSMVLRLEDPQEAEVRAEIEAGDKAASEALVEKQKAAAERRHEREAEELAMSLEERVAAEEAEEAGAAEEPGATEGVSATEESGTAEDAGATEATEAIGAAEEAGEADAGAPDPDAKIPPGGGLDAADAGEGEVRPSPGDDEVGGPGDDTEAEEEKES